MDSAAWIEACIFPVKKKRDKGVCGKDPPWRCAGGTEAAGMQERQSPSQQENSFHETEGKVVITNTKWQRPKLRTVDESHFAFLSVYLAFEGGSDTFWTE